MLLVVMSELICQNKAANMSGLLRVRKSLTDNEREPEAPAKAEGQRDVLEADIEGLGRHEQVKDKAGEAHEHASDNHCVGTIARYIHQQHVHQKPRCEG